MICTSLYSIKKALFRKFIIRKIFLISMIVYLDFLTLRQMITFTIEVKVLISYLTLMLDLAKEPSSYRISLLISTTISMIVKFTRLVEFCKMSEVYTIYLFFIGLIIYGRFQGSIYFSSLISKLYQVERVN